MSSRVDEATPRPWKRSCFLVTSQNGDWVTHTGMGNLPPSRSHESEANADLIVKAVNAYEVFEAALSKAQDDFRSLSKGAGTKVARVQAERAYQRVREALALTEQNSILGNLERQ